MADQSAPISGRSAAQLDAISRLASSLAPQGAQDTSAVDTVKSLIIRFQDGSLTEVTNVQLRAAVAATRAAAIPALAAAPSSGPVAAAVSSPASSANMPHNESSAERASSPGPEGPKDGDWILAADFGFDVKFLWSGGVWVELHCQSGNVFGVLSAKRPIKGDVHDFGVKWTPRGKAAIPIDVGLAGQYQSLFSGLYYDTADFHYRWYLVL